MFFEPTQSNLPEAAATGGSEQRAAARVATPRSGGHQENSLGASSSNTAPANCTDLEKPTHLLRTGIDSIYITHHGTLNEASYSSLQTLKALAQSEEPDLQTSAVLESCDHRFEVKPHGRKPYAFVLADNWYQISLSKRGSRLPLAHTQIGSEILTRSGVESALWSLNGIIDQLGRIESPPKVSRVDLCLDFTTSTELESFHRDAWICRSNKFHKYYEGQFSGYVFGRSGAISCRLYDKTLEIVQQSNKTYLYPLWEASGWNKASPVWRLEFQFQREILHQFGVKTIEELLERRADLWAYATENWLRLTIPSETDHTKARWPTHPLWEELSLATWGVERREPLYRTTKHRLPSDERLYVHGLGALTSHMAREGIASFDEGWSSYHNAMRQYHREYRGQSVATYAREKAQEKARRYNTRLSPPSDDDSREGA